MTNTEGFGSIIKTSRSHTGYEIPLRGVNDFPPRICYRLGCHRPRALSASRSIRAYSLSLSRESKCAGNHVEICAPKLTNLRSDLLTSREGRLSPEGSTTQIFFLGEVLEGQPDQQPGVNVLKTKFPLLSQHTNVFNTSTFR